MKNSEAEAFTPMWTRLPKNRRSQLLAIAAVLLIVLGGIWPSRWHAWIGAALLVGGFGILIGTTIWAIRNWEWDR